MKLTERVCTLEQAKKLVELGVVLKTAMYWIQVLKHNKPTWILTANKLEIENCIPAPNVAELGVLLPDRIDPDLYWEATRNELHVWNVEIFYDYKIKTPDWELKSELFSAETEAQARTDALIWLIDNDFVKVEGLKL